MIEQIIEKLRNEKQEECESCSCSYTYWCQGYNKALDHVIQQVKNVDLADVGGSLPTQDEVKREAEKLYKSMMNGTFEDIRQAKTSQLMFLSGAWFARGFKKQ